MFFHIAWFEIKFWLRSWLLWVFFLILGLLAFALVTTSQVTVGGAFSNTNKNAPYVIQTYYGVLSIFLLCMMAAFINSSALRDFRFNTNQIVFSTPISRSAFLLGRFVGGTLVSVIPMLGISVGILLGKFMPWVDSELWGPVYWSAHLHAITVQAIPTVFFMVAVLFAGAVIVRNEVIPFVAALVLLLGYIAGDFLLSDIKYEKIAALLDPFGVRTFSLATKYWTVAEKNTTSLGWSGLMLWNRLLWIAVGVSVFLFAYFRFNFAEKRTKAAAVKVGDDVRPFFVALPAFQFHKGYWAKFWGSLKLHMRATVISLPFIIIVLAAAINCGFALAFNAT